MKHGKKEIAILLSLGVLFVGATTFISRERGQLKEVELSTVHITSPETKDNKQTEVDENIVLNLDGDSITVAMQYSSYNEDKKVSETKFSEPMPMKNKESIKFVLSELKDMKFSYISNETRDELMAENELTYDIKIYDGDDTQGSVRFLGLDKIVYIKDDYTYISQLNADDSKEKIMKLVTFFKPVHF